MVSASRQSHKPLRQPAGPERLGLDKATGSGYHRLMIRLDDRDIAILKVLAREGRLSKAELARRIALSPTPCWERLKRLEKAGIIEGYGARIALKKLAPHVTVFVTLELASHGGPAFQAFEQRIARREEIRNCWALGGGFDYLLHIVTSDIDSYQRLIDDLLEGGPAVARYYTYIVTKAVKTDGAPPLDLLLGLPADTASGDPQDGEDRSDAFPA
jgi:Lrp/AsnC family transcriptional regulator of ectoine degradation